MPDGIDSPGGFSTGSPYTYIGDADFLNSSTAGLKIDSNSPFNTSEISSNFYNLVYGTRNPLPETLTISHSSKNFVSKNQESRSELTSPETFSQKITFPDYTIYGDTGKSTKPQTESDKNSQVKLSFEPWSPKERSEAAKLKTEANGNYQIPKVVNEGMAPVERSQAIQPQVEQDRNFQILKNVSVVAPDEVAPFSTTPIFFNGQNALTDGMFFLAKKAFNSGDADFGGRLEMVINDYLELLITEPDSTRTRLVSEALKIWVDPNKAVKYRDGITVPMCNKFVNDATENVGIPQSVFIKADTDLETSLAMAHHIAFTRPPIAGEYADPNKLKLKTVLQISKQGDGGTVVKSTREPMMGDIYVHGAPTMTGSAAHVGIYLGHDIYISATTAEKLGQVDIVIKEIVSDIATFRSVDDK